MPDAPVNVRLVRPDGEVVPIEFVYAGRDPDGIDVWDSVRAVTFDLAGVRVEADKIPGHCLLDIRADPS